MQQQPEVETVIVNQVTKCSRKNGSDENRETVMQQRIFEKQNSLKKENISLHLSPWEQIYCIFWNYIQMLRLLDMEWVERPYTNSCLRVDFQKGYINYISSSCECQFHWLAFYITIVEKCISLKDMKISFLLPLLLSLIFLWLVSLNIS